MSINTIIFIVLTVLATAAAADQWRDAFTSRELDKRWTWYTPVPGPTISLTERPGWLRLTVPQTVRGFNHWIREQRATFLRTPAPAGDWNLNARITLSDHRPSSNLHLALVVVYSEEKVLAWGPFLSKAIYPETNRPTIWAEPTGQGSFIRTDVDPENVELQISKRVDSYHLCYRREGETRWTDAGCYYGGGFKPQFVGLMGKSFGPNPAGSLDVDYIELVPKQHTPEQLEMGSVAIGPGPGQRLPSFQRGFFLEFLGHCIFQGIWDERLHNRKFIGPDTQTGVVWGWTPIGEAKGCAPDYSQPYSEPQSQRNILADAEAGVLQQGVALQKNRKYAVRIVVKASGHVRAVSVSLRDEDGVHDRHTFRIRGEDWQTHTCELTATRDANGSFAVASKGPGELWIGAASMMGADNVKGFRRDLLELTRSVKPASFRWPGGNMASGYHWRDGVGPRDRRPTCWDRAWNAWVYNDMGTDEFIEYCRLLHAEPCICVNAGEGLPDEAAAWVEYCNGAPHTPMGKLRTANGHPEPYNVKYWDIGNEIWGEWQLGHVGPEHYGLRAVEFARAMRRADPNIVLIASGVLDDAFDDWNRKMLHICGAFVDMLSVHDYTRYDARQCNGGTWLKVVGAPLRIERSLRNTVKIAEEAAGKHLPLTLDEWNTTPQWARGGHGLVDAIYAAGVLHAVQRCGDDVPIGNLSLLVNPLGAMRTTQTRVLQTPVFLALRLFAENSGPWNLEVEIESPRFQNMPTLDVAATLSEDKSTLYITAINRDQRRAVTIDWNLGDFAPRGQMRRTTLSGPEPWARNTDEGPDVVSLASEQTSWNEARRLPLPTASVTAFSVPLK